MILFLPRRASFESSYISVKVDPPPQDSFPDPVPASEQRDDRDLSTAGRQLLPTSPATALCSWYKSCCKEQNSSRWQSGVDVWMSLQAEKALESGVPRPPGCRHPCQQISSNLLIAVLPLILDAPVVWNGNGLMRVKAVSLLRADWYGKSICSLHVHGQVRPHGFSSADNDLNGKYSTDDLPLHISSSIFDITIYLTWT